MLKEQIENTVYQYQNNHPEVIIHQEWKKGNYFRFVVEQAGDILRELSIREDNPEWYAVSYIKEKTDGVESYLWRMREDIGTSEKSGKQVLFNKNSVISKEVFDLKPLIKELIKRDNQWK